MGDCIRHGGICFQIQECFREKRIFVSDLDSYHTESGFSSSVSGVVLRNLYGKLHGHIEQ